MRKFAKLFAILLAFVMVLSATACGSDEPTPIKATSTKSSKTSSAKLSKKVKITEDAETLNGKVVAIIKNNNTKTVDLDVEVVFYDEDDKLLGSDDTTIYAVPKKSETVAWFYEVPEDYSKYEITVDVEESRYKGYASDIKIESNDTGSKIVAQAEIDTKVDLDSVELITLFYKNDEIVGFDNDYEYDVEAGDTLNMNFNYPYDSNYKTIEYDDFKVLVVSAQKY